MGIGSRAVGGGDVCDEHGWERRGVAAGEVGDGELGLVEVGVALVGSAGDFDGGAVHVHFAVAHFVEPGPREGVCAWRDALRDGEVVGVWVRSVGVFSEIAGRVLGRATSLDGMDDHPFGALRRRAVGRQ